MSERDVSWHKASTDVALSIGEAARNQARGGAKSGDTYVSLGKGAFLNTSRPYTVDSGHWPGDGLNISGTVKGPDGTNSDVILTIKDDGAHFLTELPDITDFK